MRTMKLTLGSGVFAAVLGTSLVVGCSDDSGGGSGGGGSGGNSAGVGNKSDAGEGGGGTATAGTTGAGTSGSGGTDGGEAGEGYGGEPGLPEIGAGIEPEAARVIDNAVNPYGATFSEDGYLYVSGAVDTGPVAAVQSGADLRLAVWRFTADNELDTSFGSNGVAISNIANPGTSYDIVELTDGSFVVHMSGGAYGVALTTLTVTGPAPAFSAPTTIDFGWTAAEIAQVGTLCTPAAGTAEAAEHLAAQAVGEVCHAGSLDTAACDALIAASHGTTDAAACRAAWPAAASPAFSQRPSTGASWGIALDSSSSTEKIVVFADAPAPKVSAGTQRIDNDRYIARVLASDFSIDTDFNEGEVLTVDINGAGLSDGSRRGAVEEDGSIISVGYTSFDGNNHVHVMRVLPNGALDPDFGFSDDDAYPWTGGYTHFNPFEGPGQTDGAAEAYAVALVGEGAYVTTGYGRSYFETATIENDLVTFRILADGLDTAWGGNASGDAKFGSAAIQSETDPGAGIGTRPFRENGRDLVAMADGRTIQVGCYDDFASIFVLTDDGKLDQRVGAGTGRLQFTHPFPFFKVAISKDGRRVAATTQSRPKSATTYARAFLATLAIDVE